MKHLPQAFEYPFSHTILIIAVKSKPFSSVGSCGQSNQGSVLRHHFPVAQVGVLIDPPAWSVFSKEVQGLIQMASFPVDESSALVPAPDV